MCESQTDHRTIMVVENTRDLAAYEKNRRALQESLTAMGYRMASPDGAFYLFIQAPTGMICLLGNGQGEKPPPGPRNGLRLPGLVPDLLLRLVRYDSKKPAGLPGADGACRS